MSNGRAIAVLIGALVLGSSTLKAQGPRVIAPAERTSLVADGELDRAVANIRRAWVRERATGTGAVIGGAVGLVAGVTYGLLITRPESSPCDADNCTRAGVTAVSGLLGTAIGAGLGAIVGTLIHTSSLAPDAPQ